MASSHSSRCIRESIRQQATLILVPWIQVPIPRTFRIPHANGVILYADHELQRDIWVRLREAEDGRWEIVELYIAPTDRPVGTDDLRRIPLGRIEAFANEPHISQELRGTTPDPPSLERLARMEQSRANAMANAEAFLLPDSPGIRARRLRVAVPKMRPYPEAFYRRIATLYSELAAAGSRPASVIAEANNVPTTTVHRWIRECRIRELLPAGRTGKAG